MIRSCVSSQSQPHDVVEATGWLKMRVYPPVLWRAGVGKGADAMTVNRGLDLAGRGENRGNLGRAIPWTHLFFNKSGCVGLCILGVHPVSIKIKVFIYYADIKYCHYLKIAISRNGGVL